MISCWHCKGSHKTSREVYNCSRTEAVVGAGPKVSMGIADDVTFYDSPNSNGVPASEKQVNFVRSLIARKDGHNLTLNSDWSLLDKRSASDVIERLLKLPYKATMQKPVQLPNVPAGYYAVDDKEITKFYRVDRPTKGQWAGRTFLKVQASDEFWPVKSHDEVQRVLLAIAVDSGAAQARYGKLIGRCGICNRTLTDDYSRSVGLGPICRNK